MKRLMRTLLSIYFICNFTTAFQVDPGLTETKYIERERADTSIVLESPTVTNWGRWGRWAVCTTKHSYVRGFQLKVEAWEEGIDNTAVNGITLSCGIPEQKEIERIRSSEGPWGNKRDRLFCENGYTQGFQLKVQPPQKSGVDDAATVNVRMICGDGTVQQGYDDMDQEFPGSFWSEPVVCPKDTAVCGMQTQVEPRRLWGDDTALNNIRINCCALPSDQHDSGPSTNPKFDFNLTYYKSYGGVGENETKTYKYGKCYNIAWQWRGQIKSIHKTIPCFRMWQHIGCNGISRCYCDNDLLSLNDSFLMKRDVAWQEHLMAIGPCHKDGWQSNEMYAEAILYAENGDKSGVILEPGECQTYYEGDIWNRRTEKVVLAKGCLNLYDGEECTGQSLRVNKEMFEVGSEWRNRTVAVKNCLDHKE